MMQMNGSTPQGLPRRLAVLVPSLAAVIIVAALCYLLYGDRRQGRYSTYNYNKIRAGAPLSEVEALLGGPGEDLSRELPPGTLNTPAQIPHRFFEWKEPGG